MFHQSYHQFYNEQSYHQFNILTNQSYHQYEQFSHCFKYLSNNSFKYTSNWQSYHYKNLSNNTLKNAFNWQLFHLKYTSNHDYKAQQFNHFSSYNLTDNKWQSHHIKYSSKSQWNHHNKLFHENENISSYSVYFADFNLYKYEDALSNKYDLFNKIKSSHHINDSSQSQHKNFSFLCTFCQITFENTDSLHTHTLNWHDINIHTVSTQKTSNYINYTEHATQHIVIISQSSSHDYTVIKAVLFQHNNETTICLNTESITTFIDQNLVNKTKIKWTALIIAENFFRK